MKCKFENQCPVLLCVYMPTPIVWEIRCYHVHGDLREDRVGEQSCALSSRGTELSVYGALGDTWAGLWDPRSTQVHAKFWGVCNLGRRGP